jgi:hypothetical protein
LDRPASNHQRLFVLQEIVESIEKNNRSPGKMAGGVTEGIRFAMIQVPPLH